MSKKIFIYIIMCCCAMIMVNCSGGKTEQEADPVALSDSLRNVMVNKLRTLQESGIIAFGHHDDPAYGVNWEYVPGGSDVKSIAGDYPAVFDWDLEGIEYGRPVQIDSVPFDFISEHAVKHHLAGGINTFSWHVDNPITGGNAWDVSDHRAIHKLLNKPAQRDTMIAWIGRVADYIGSLRDPDGNRIPVVFRPWHENTGSWFWWGADYCTPSDYKELYKLTRQVFDEHGIDNVAWAFSPGSIDSEEEYMEYYPGDEYVDILGIDTYMGGAKNEEGFIQRMRQQLGILQTVAAKHRKPMALTETGHETILVTDWYTRLLYPIISDYPVAYVVVWRNSNKIANHYYVPYPGHPAAPDFKKFVDMPNIALLGDMPK